MSQLYEEFTKWWDTLDEYDKLDLEKHSCFRGWSACKHSTKIELPKEHLLEYNVYGNPYSNECSTYQGCFYEVQELEDALDKAGVKY